MAFDHGKDSYFSLEGVNLTTFIDSIEHSPSLDMAETSTMGDEAKTYIPGLSDNTLSISGNFDPTDTTGPDDVLWDAYSGKAPLTFEFGPGGNANGAIKYSGECYVTSYTVSSGVGDKVTFSADIQVTGEVTRGTFS